MGKAGRPPALLTHPRRDEILQALLEPGANFEKISREFGTSRKALQTWQRRNVSPVMQRALETVARTQERMPATALTVLGKIDLLLERGLLIFDACHAWLLDPDGSGKYSLNPRSGEVEVIVEEFVPGPPPRVVRRSERLDKLLEDIEVGLGVRVLRGEVKVADPRKLILDVISTLQPVLKLLGTVRGEIKPESPTVQLQVFLGSPGWQRLEAAMVEAIRPCTCGCAERLARALDSVTEPGDDDVIEALVKPKEVKLG